MIIRTFNCDGLTIIPYGPIHIKPFVDGKLLRYLDPHWGIGAKGRDLEELIEDVLEQLKTIWREKGSNGFNMIAINKQKEGRNEAGND